MNNNANKVPTTRRDVLLHGVLASTVGSVFRPAWSSSDVFVPPPVRQMKIVENTWIDMPDGVRLAARIFVPDDATKNPVGAVLEYIPYRKRTGYRYIDNAVAAWMVPRGFAFVRVDVRGTGESDGLMVNEYDLPEQKDVEPLIRWISEQPWCNGNVGMRGISYGSITSIQAANKGIPELKAIIPCVGTDNGYTDDVHTINGCVINEKVIWGAIWKAIMIDPPDPELVGDEWLEIWLNRLDGQIPLVSEWMKHQLVDEYWRNRIVTDYSKIKCGVYVLGGLIDSYINTVPRLLENLDCPRKGLVGPWGHDFPQDGVPGPRLDWAVEEVRWWDYWLNGNDNGIMDEPMLRTYIADTHTRQSYPADTPGRWVSEEAWPSRNVEIMELYAAANETLTTAKPKRERVQSPPYITIGGCIPILSPYDMATQAPVEQSPDDELSLVFETPPLPTDVEIVGCPKLRFKFSANKPIAKLAARLNAISADGKSWLVTYGAANLAHNSDHTSVEEIQPGIDQPGELVFHYISRRIAKGARIRLSISQSQWPIVWPSPESVDISLVLGETALELPVRSQPVLETPMTLGVVHQEEDVNPAPDNGDRLVEYSGEAETRRARIKAAQDHNTRLLDEINMTVGSSWNLDGELIEGDPNSNRMSLVSKRTAERPGWNVSWQADATLTSTPKHFIVDEGIEAWHNAEKIFSRRWKKKIKRIGN